MHAANFLESVYWLGGSPCAGKSTIATLLGEQLGWRVYHCDDFYGDHKRRATPVDQPVFYALARLSGDALWLRPVTEQIVTEINFCADEFSLVLEDLAQIAAEDERPLLFEGTAVLPHLLQPRLASTQHAFYLLPSQAFQMHYYAQRPWIHDILATTSDPEQAFANWMERDASFARWVERQATQYGMAWLAVDGTLTIAETAARVAHHFGVG